MPTLYRQATTTDLDGIVATFLGCWRVSYAPLLPRRLTEAMTDERAVELWTRVLGESAGEAAGADVIVAESPEELGTVILGVARLAVDAGGEGSVPSLYVSPGVQGRGVGSGLLAAAVDALLAAGSITAHLWVFRDNSPARAFYRHSGWYPDGRTRVQAEFGEPEIRLTALLAARGPGVTARASGSIVGRGGPEGLAATAARLVAVVPAGCPAGTTPPAGVALALRAPGLEASAAAGFRGVARPDGAEAAALTVDTHHDVASVTKVLATTAALLRLASDGVVGLDDAACRYLPGLTDGEKASITVRQLLAHRAGLWEWQPLYLAAGDAHAAAELVERLPLRYRPETGHHYSDLGFMLLGRIVAVVTGQSFEDAVRALVTEPLGMASTRFAHPAGDEVATSAFGDQCERVMVDTGSPYPVPFDSAAFSSWRQDPITGDVCDGNAFHVYDGVSGHAGLFSTLTDLVTFGSALANYPEHENLWRPEVAEEFFAPGPDAGQALGFRRYHLDLGSESVEVLGHPGFVGSAVGFVPGRGIALALASNRLLTPGTPVLTEQLWLEVLAAAGRALRKQAA